MPPVEFINERPWYGLSCVIAYPEIGISITYLFLSPSLEGPKTSEHNKVQNKLKKITALTDQSQNHPGSPYQNHLPPTIQRRAFTIPTQESEKTTEGSASAGQTTVCRDETSDARNPALSTGGVSSITAAATRKGRHLRRERRPHRGESREPRRSRYPRWWSCANSTERRQQDLTDLHVIGLASVTGESGLKVVRGEPSERPRIVSRTHELVSPTIGISDSSLKFTHDLYNLSPAANGNGRVVGTGRHGLPKIQTEKKDNEICIDDSTPPVRAQTIDELHSLQKKKSAPTTPIKPLSSQEQLQSISKIKLYNNVVEISASLASLTRESGPKVVRGDPAEKPCVVSHSQQQHVSPTIGVSDSSLKFTHVLYNLSPAELYEQAIKYEKGSFITSSGAIATLSGAKTGRSPKDKRVVRDETTEDDLWWGKGSPNIEMDEHTFMVNRERAVDYLNSLDKVFVNDQFLNWDPQHRIKVRIVSARAYHSLFMHNMCIRPTPEELENFGTPDFTIYNAGQFPCNRYTHYMTSSTSVDLNLGRREMVILGTQYAGEMKKGLFSVMHYLMPKRQILSLHSGCNMGKDGDVALFFGLSGTGKTTLSTDHNRFLIGDDEHCWSENGVSNIEGGCYAKCIDLSREKEPDIWNAIKFGTVLENVVFDEHTREVDYSDKSVTENTRAAYPIEYIPNAKIPCVASHPKNVILLACDAFGVLPPVSKLSLAQTMYHFISGYTALVAGTEDGIKEPQATFSACFGAAFIMLHPTKYAAMLAAKMQKHGATGWLVNTGWSGGSYGSGSRIKLAYTRKIIDAIHSGSLLDADYKKTEVFGLEIPTEVEGVPSEILEPTNTWSDKNAYKETLLNLAGLFKNNFGGFVAHKIGKDDKLTDEILAAGPVF
ncbi:phosphoenolpyruvate carboxykinase [Striga asiatica]|uniref:phosphoenolpyruvate carboxykinase (ATP) n=1 Tax=Striga asiatica TaxID=4170 RepID=A0A5A7QRN7_STRAF|nr:phosphoenolpyruvate carboxykinase [Striga asiatica]